MNINSLNSRLHFFLKPLGAMMACGMIMASCSGEDAPGANTGNEGNEGKNETPEFVEKTPLKSTPDLQKAVAGQYAVGSHILGELIASNKDGNQLFSPFSFHVAASMLANGLGDAEATELVRFLGADNVDFLNSTNSELISTVPALDSQVTYEIANAVWTDTALPVKEDFKTTLANSYSSELQTVNYGTEDATGIINTWVKEKTHGMIDELFNPTEPLLGPVTIVNTLYLKAPWSQSFDKKNSYTGTFHSPKGDLQADFMHEDEMLGSYDRGDFGESLTLNFGKRGNYRITFIMPSSGTDLGAWASRLSADRMMEIVSGGKSVECEVTLPKFGSETAIERREMHKSMGLARSFTLTLCSGMTASSNPIFVNKIIQKVKFTVDEKGGEGSAATGMANIGSSGAGDSEPQKYVFKADRPFMFVVTERGCKTPIFMGVVQNP